MPYVVQNDCSISNSEREKVKSKWVMWSTCVKRTESGNARLGVYWFLVGGL